MRIAKDGWIFILGVPAVPAVFAAVLYLAGILWGALALAAIAAVTASFMVYFFRDPERWPPAGPDELVAGADGTVRRVEELEDVPHLASPAVRVSVFLSPMNVHINRSPMKGEVLYAGYTPGKRLFTFQDAASEYNEHSTIVIQGDRIRCLVRQIVGPVVRRVVYWLEKGEIIEKGARIGLMKFGSRLDVYFPRDAVEICVKKGDKVRAGETVIARIKGMD